MDYSSAKVYKIYIEDQPESFYIGGTITSLSQKVANTKENIQKSNSKFYSTIKNKNIKIELVEKYKCKNRIELNERIKYWINKLKPTLNRSKKVNEKICTIYKIYCTKNPKLLFIGSTFMKLYCKINSVREFCRKGHNNKLYNTMRKNGINNFKIEKLAETKEINRNEINKIVQKWKCKLHPTLNK